MPYPYPYPFHPGAGSYRGHPFSNRAFERMNQQQVGVYPQQLVGAYPQLVGAAGNPHLVGRYPYGYGHPWQQIGATPQMQGNYAPPGAVDYAPDPGGAIVYPLIGNNPGSTGTVIVDGVPEQTRQWPFPMPALTLLGGAIGQTTNIAQLMIRPQRLVITETAGPSTLTDIRVGQRSQFINAGGAVPITMFAFNAVDSLVNFDTAQIGHNVTLIFQNNGLDETILSSAMLCVTAV